MLRSEINSHIRWAKELCSRHQVYLPPWGYWSPEDWAAAGHEVDEVRDCMMGWDVAAYGQKDFALVGLVLFTIRNGHPDLPAYPKPYCEKHLFVGEGQVTPYHFHRHKTEDIINRGGGNLLTRVYNATADEELADTPVAVNVDGRRYEVAAGSTIRLTPGESITLPPYCYHSFWGEAGHGPVLVGEVSTVNDDKHDNRFLDGNPRFAVPQEDVPAVHLLCNEYPPAPK